MVNYDGRRFRNTAYAADEAPLAIYRQQGDLLWGDFAGGDVRRGSLTGVSDVDGILDFTYTMVLADGEVVAGRCHSEPLVLDDGRIRLVETWERYGDGASTGVSELEEVR
ncbi:hypothetical protein [Hamadaea tsunoensis]|uniref:hypothetical protein n=1 Tax=Hamadaea tsunoensis TaxID=53368 RepID=UPI000414D523|nr:hypothetical protein [Hamadaea tsunoensis]